MQPNAHFPEDSEYQSGGDTQYLLYVFTGVFFKTKIMFLF